MNKPTSVPTLADMKLLDGRIFGTLTPEEINVLNFMKERGRKYGVAVAIVNEIDRASIVTANSQAEVQAMIERANSRVKVVSIDGNMPPMFGPSHFFDPNDYEPRAGKSSLMNEYLNKRK